MVQKKLLPHCHCSCNDYAFMVDAIQTALIAQARARQMPHPLSSGCHCDYWGQSNHAKLHGHPPHVANFICCCNAFKKGQEGQKFASRTSWLACALASTLAHFMTTDFLTSLTALLCHSIGFAVGHEVSVLLYISLSESIILSFR